MKKYIKPTIMARRVNFRNHLMQTSFGVNTTSTYNGEFGAKRGNFDDSYEDDYPGNSPHNIDLWADEVEREMAYGH